MNLERECALKAFTALNDRLRTVNWPPFTLVVGTGGAAIIAFRFLCQVSKIDATSVTQYFKHLRPLFAEVGKELRLDIGEITPYFAVFAVYLPISANSQMREIFKGEVMTVVSLGPDDRLEMKQIPKVESDHHHVAYLLPLTGQSNSDPSFKNTAAFTVGL